MITLWIPTLFDAVAMDNNQSNQTASHVYLYQEKQNQEEQTGKLDLWHGHANLSAVAKDHPNADVCLYIPSTSVLQLPQWLSSKRCQQLGESGMRYLFEEMTLTPVEQLQIKSWSVGNLHQLFALPQAQIEQWQYATELVGLKLVALLPDYLLLPIPKMGQRSVYLYFDKQTLLMRRSVSHGGAIGYLPLMVQQWLANQDNQDNDVADVDDDLLTSHVNHSTQPNHVNDEQLDNVYVISSSGLMASNDDDATWHTTVEQMGNRHGWQEGINQLLHHGIAVHGSQATLTPVAQPIQHSLNFYHIKRTSIASPYLKTAIMVMMVALALQLMVDALQIQQYSTASQATQTAIREQYQAWYPNERLNNRTQLQTQLSPKLINTAGQNDATSTQMQQISALLRQSDVVASVLNIQPEQIEMTVLANNRQSLDTLVANLQQAGMNANLGTVSNVTVSDVTVSDATVNTTTQANTTVPAPNSQVQGQLVVTLGS